MLEFSGHGTAHHAANSACQSLSVCRLVDIPLFAEHVQQDGYKRREWQFLAEQPVVKAD